MGDIDLRALMFQAGYLTIAGEERRGASTFYTLESPNLEVRASFSEGLLAHLGQDEAAMTETMEQMRGRGYADKYRGGDEPVHRIGVVFSSQKRNLLAVRAELA